MRQNLSLLASSSDELRRYIASEKGQELLHEVYECLEDVQRMARFCRARNRVCSGVRFCAGATIAGASVCVLTAGTLVATGAAAVPALACAAAGAGSVAALGIGAQVANSLVRMGWDRADAACVARRMERLKDSWKDWDFYFEQVLKAASAEENGLEGVARFLNVDILTSLAGARMYCSASTAVRAFAVGGQAARKVIYAVSGVGIVCGIMDAIGGFSGAWRGDSEGADLLDAYADQICAVLHTMLAAAATTPAHADLFGKVPHLVLIEVNRGTLPHPNYRLGDWTKKRLNGGPRDVNAYFSVALGEGRTRRTEVSIRVSPGQQMEFDARLLTRIFEHDTSLTVTAFSERSNFTKATVGDPQMGPVHVVDLAKVHLPFSNYITTGGGGSMLWLSCRRPV